MTYKVIIFEDIDVIPFFLLNIELFEGYDYDFSNHCTNKNNSTNNTTSPLVTVISTKGQTS